MGDDGYSNKTKGAQDQVQLSDGSGLKSGQIDGTLAWQSTGVLYKGCSSSKDHPILIKDCYTLSLSSDPTKNLDPDHLDSPRQKIEFSTRKGSAGETHKFRWRYYLSSQTGSASPFFHIMQLISRGGSSTGPLVTADIVNGKVFVNDNVRGGADRPFMALEDYTDRTTLHEVSVTYGDKGSFKYTVKSITDNDKLLLTYEAIGFMGHDASIKCGAYRKAVSGMTVVRAAVGDFQAE